MKYSSLQEYFYKFQNVLYLLVLLPLLAFISFFVFDQLRPATLTAAQSALLLRILIAGSIFDILISFILFKNMLKKARVLPGLGLRLERYYAITVIRFSLVSFAALVLVAG